MQWIHRQFKEEILSFHLSGVHYKLTSTPGSPLSPESPFSPSGPGRPLGPQRPWGPTEPTPPCRPRCENEVTLKRQIYLIFPGFPKISHKNKLSRADYGEEYKCKEMIFTCVPAFPASPRTPLGPEIPWRTDISDKSAILLKTSNFFLIQSKKDVTCYAHIQ